MTGKELILYILQNNLENEEILCDGKFVLFMTEDQAAVKFDVGIATIRLWHKIGVLSGIEINGGLYFLRNLKDPRSAKNQ